MPKYALDDLHAAGMELAAKSLDYQDNLGSNDLERFWNEFAEARNNYRRIRDALRGET